jgi:hypothetical protein
MRTLVFAASIVIAFLTAVVFLRKFVLHLPSRKAVQRRTIRVITWLKNGL